MVSDHSTVLDHDHRQRWDDGDIAALIELRAQGHTITVCATRLGRTTSAVRSKLYRLRRAT